MMGMVRPSMQISEDSTKNAPGKLGFWMCVALVVGSMIGSGVFLLPASLAPLGWNSVWGWLVSIGGTLCLAYAFARMARDMAGGCGQFTYAEAAFGPGIGFVIAWSFWISVWTANATLAVAAVSNLSILWPGLATTQGLPAIVAVALIWLLTLINCLGVRTAGGVQVVTTVLKLIPLAGAIMVAIWGLSTGTVIASPQPVTTTGISAAATLTLFAMLGFESALAAGDRIENPERNIPRAVLMGTAITGLIYLLACSAVTLLLPPDELARSNAPFALFFSVMVSPALGGIVALFAAIAALGALNGYVLTQGEMLLALARRGLFPRWFASQNRYDVPHRIHYLSSGLASIVVLSNYTRGLSDLFLFMVLVTTSVTIIFYLAGALASFKLVRSGRIGASAGFEAIAVIAAIYSVWAFYGAGLEASIWSLGMTAVGLPIYWFMTRSPPAQQPAE